MKLAYISVACTLAMLSGGCQTGSGGSEPQSSSVAHWLECGRFSDCAEAASAVGCEDGYCIDADGDRIEVGKSSGGTDDDPDDVALDDDVTQADDAASEPADDDPPASPSSGDDTAPDDAASDDDGESDPSTSAGGGNGSLDVPSDAGGSGAMSGGGERGVEVGGGGGSANGGSSPDGGFAGSIPGTGGASTGGGPSSGQEFQDEWANCETADDCVFLPANTCCSCELVAANRQFESEARSTIAPFDPTACGDLGCAGFPCDPRPLAACIEGKCVAEPGCTQRTLDECEGDERCSLYRPGMCPAPQGGSSLAGICESLRDPDCGADDALLDPVCRVDPANGLMLLFPDGCAPPWWTQECPLTVEECQ